MTLLNLDFWLLLISTLLIILLLIYLLKKKDNTKSQLRIAFTFNLIFILIISIGVLLQAFCTSYYNIDDPILFENFIYIGTCFLPVSIFFTSLIFVNTKIKLKKSYLLLFIIPIISLIVLWTNDYHHLFYKIYSINMYQTQFGMYFYIHCAYTYILYFIGIINILKYSIKNSGFFSKQALLITLGGLIPILINLLGIIGIISITFFSTPISFALSIICFALAIFKFDFLKVAPIALQRVVDRMSDGYIIVNDENIVTDFNQTFLELFSLKTSELRNININDLITKLSSNSEKRHTFLNAINKTKSDDTTIKIESHFSRVK